MMNRWGILIVGLLLVGLHYCVQFLTTKSDPRKPSLISSKISFIEHLVDLLRHELAYYAKAR
jgi:hypothetical protein